MPGTCPVFRAGQARVRACLWLGAAICMILSTPAQTRAFDVRLHWSPSTDSRVQGYYVYVREATKPYGAPVDAGAARQASGGTVDWIVSGLSSSTTYFVAVSAYTSSRVESPLSNELPIGSPDPCVQDTCTSPTQCTVRSLPDGSACGPPGAAGCGSTCLAGTCVGLAEHGFSLDRLKLKRSDQQLKVQVNAHFATTTLFAPQTSGLELTLADGDGNAVLDATLGAADLVASGNVMKLLRRRGDTAPVQLRRLVLRTRGADTIMKAQILAAPPPASLPDRATVALQSGALCLAAPRPECESRVRTPSCR
jgi:hypothetical protein